MYKNYEALLAKTHKTNYGVAKDTGVSQSVLSQWKNEKTVPSIGTLRKIANYFGVTVDYLIGDEGETPAVVRTEISSEQYEKYVRLRDIQGVTDAQVADATGIGRSTFSDWKSGRCAPKAGKLLRIADYFDVSIEYFLRDDEKELNETRGKQNETVQGL